MSKITKGELLNYIGLKTDGYWSEVYLEICTNKTGVARGYITGKSTPFHTGGDDDSDVFKRYVVLAQFVNYYIDNNIDFCVDIESFIEAVAKNGIGVKYICQTKSGFLYKIENKLKSNTYFYEETK